MTSFDNAGTVEDQLAIELLIYRYARAFDSLDGAAFAECFAADAILTGPNVTWRGGFAQHLEAFRRPGSQVGNITEMHHIIGMHHMFNHLYTVQDRVATGVTYCKGIMLQDNEGKPTYRDMYIRYRDELVKRDSRWQFRKREFELLCYSDPIPVQRLAENERNIGL